ncbi:MAG: carbohydrate binding family 9 domain-containing protein [Deltaproteobacteria bacterium]|nr:carbohydrate binding family 9 domain-containing protein [Deltaproteobacteria bacterium]
MKVACPLASATLGLALYAGSALAVPPVVHARRGTPALDGALDDALWRSVAPAAGFLQRQPTFGAAATHGTTVRVAYDDRALYVAVACVTRGRPEQRLSRRDVLPPGEWVRVLVDGRAEGNSAFAFTVNPAGVQVDALVRGDGEDNTDVGWDAVWSAETAVTDDGWSAEFELPWRVLRFDAERPDFRLQVERNDFQLGELSSLAPIPADAPAFVSRFARLRGVVGITPRRIFELRPYALGVTRMLEDPSRLDTTATLSGSLGADLKLGLTQDLVLDLTANPEFGTTEVDPAFVNLSTFEVQLVERRPFFLEGRSLFRTPLTVLHTRRIGAAQEPPGPSRPEATVTSSDPLARVWGAAQLAGRVGAWSVAVLDAVTAPVAAVETTARDGALVNTEREVSPGTNWLALRLRRPLREGSSLGLIATHVGRAGQPHYLVGGMDWDWRFPDNVHRHRGQLLFSHAWNPSDGQRDGYGFFAEVARAESPVFLWSARVRSYSRGFDLNGLGYLERGDMVRLVADFTLRTPRPVGFLRNVEWSGYAIEQHNTAGVLLERGFGTEVYATSRSLWTLGVGAELQAARFDDRETRGGIPYALAPGIEAYGWFQSDTRRAVRFRLQGGVDTYNGGRRAGVGLQATVIPTTFATLSLQGTVRFLDDPPRWVETVTDNVGVEHPVFGLQRGRIYELIARANLALSRRASLDVFSQVLLGDLRYRDYRELVAPDRWAPFAYGGDASFERAVLKVNAIARYEYRPGSFLSVAFVHAALLRVAPGEPGYGLGLSLLGQATPETRLLAKLTWLFT